ncbi:hypothetical protein [Limnoglobus roseus]|uniref:Uncharacterized protein n=1 Tax=Limnoglobus roseus TaxID=2598579 RepID=A0A5C1AAM0_9BACT|nr:hypothetical protein [Limnoglobus roseus]QEL14164.1 hypothetical protein PX52LOC_01034 [Limnoglobus roseus]
MGVEHRCYLIPKPGTFRPRPDTALALVAALRDDGWVLAPDHAALAKLSFASSTLYKRARRHGYFTRTVGQRASFTAPLAELLANFAERDLMVVWPVESLGVSGLRYPLEPLPFDDPADAAECYYEFQLHFGRDLIYHTSEGIDPFEPPPTCDRGHPVTFEPESDFDPFFASRLAARCPKCGSEFDPSQLVATGRDGWTGGRREVQGGAAYRFAIVIDCGKFFGPRPLRFHPRLRRLVEQVLGVETYEVPDFY